MRKATGSYRTYSYLVKLQPRFLSLHGRPAVGKTAAWVPVLPVKDLPLGRTLMMMMMMMMMSIIKKLIRN